MLKSKKVYTEEEKTKIKELTKVAKYFKKNCNKDYISNFSDF